MDISVLAFNKTSAEIKNISSIDEVTMLKNRALPHREREMTYWINVNGLEDSDSIKKIAEVYDIHLLTVEDIFDTIQQPKVEAFGTYRYMSFKSIQRKKDFHLRQNKKKRRFGLNFRKKTEEGEDEEEFSIEHISMITMKNVLITFQEKPGDPFDKIRKRILENIGQIRRKGTVYLEYSLIDAVVDEYYLTLAHMEDDIENLEDRAVKTNDDSFFMEIQDAKRYLLQIKRSIQPLRDNLINISHQDVLTVNEELKPFLQDLRENLQNAIVRVENYREWLTNILDVNLSFLSHQMNKVMKTLAVISSIFIPLTFIAGIYGMNFEFMPELSIPWAYPVVLGGMAFMSLMMIVFFKIRRWF
jgi:magnesium transporter